MYNSLIKPTELQDWDKIIMEYVDEHGELPAKQAREIWNVTPKTAESRLCKMRDKGLLVEISSGHYDLQKRFVKPGNGLSRLITRLFLAWSNY